MGERICVVLLWGGGGGWVCGVMWGEGGGNWYTYSGMISIYMYMYVCSSESIMSYTR